MELDAYRTFTRELTAGLAGDARVVGVVALGSMAELDPGPDRWSDHDFFVVTRAGEQEALRQDLAWLPRHDDVVLAFRETEHGLRVVYRDGHLLELAVFDLDELRVAAVNRYRVLHDRGGVAERMAEVARRSAEAARHPPDPAALLGLVTTNVLVGVGRHRRGEALSGAFLVKGAGVRHLLLLLTATLPADRADLLDELDPFRRFDAVHPAIAREVESLLRSDTEEAGLGLLDLAERHLRGRLPALSWEALDVVRRRLASP